MLSMLYILLQTLFLGSVLCISVITTYIVYNAFFHPLARVPGPFWARTTSLPSWYHARKGDRHVWLWQCFQIYGTKIRPTPNSVVFCDPEAAKEIYTSRANVQRSGFYKAWVMTGTEPSTLNTTDVSEHASKRKLLNLLFTEKAVRAASVFVIKHTDRWHELLGTSTGSGWSDSFDFSKSIDLMIFDVMGDMCFGRSFDVKEPGDNQLRAIPHIIMKFMKFWYPICRLPFLDLVLWLKPRGFDAFLAKNSPPVVKMYDEFVAESVRERLAQERSDKGASPLREDMLHFLHGAKDPDTGLPAFNDNEILAEARFLVIAGADSTSISLAALIFYLSLPAKARCLEKVTVELRTLFQSADEITYGPKLQSCIYLKACIDEAMRLAPTSPSELPREVRPGGITIRAEFFPPGTIVGAQSYSTYRNPESFSSNHEYWPERWIIDKSTGVTEAAVARARNSFFPWSNGPGNCAGKNLAIMELLIIAARTLWRFDIRRAPGSSVGGGASNLGWGRDDPDHYVLVDAYIADREGPVIQVKRARQRP